ncbi:MAG TPA: 50S ribosomal protein L21 [Pyrinomonadaceae bacterium]|jgi:large subunit ribosomal protein L21|nr:50S ribosomal protein L21 [Pyrinomonadaceae bacterium]
MAYAIIRSGGKQFRVEEGATVRLPSINKEAGEAVELEALVVGGADGVKIGSPLVEGARIAATVVDHGRGDKIIVFKMKRRKQYKRTKGHRQNYTTVKIDSIG